MCEDGRMSPHTKRGIGVCVLVTVIVGGSALLLGGASGVINPCPNPPDWMPRWMITGIFLAFLGSPVIGVIAGVVAARNRKLLDAPEEKSGK